MILLLAACAADPLDLRASLVRPGSNVGGALWLEVETRVPATLRVTIDDGFREREAFFAVAAATRSVPLLGFRPDRVARIEVEVESDGAVSTASLEATIPPLPARFPIVEVLALDRARVEPGWTLLDIKVPNDRVDYVIVLDEEAVPIWWWAAEDSVGDCRLTDRGLLWTLAKGATTERDWFGRQIAGWGLAGTGNWTVTEAVSMNHESAPIAGGFLTLDPESVAVDAYPVSEDEPDVFAPANLDGGEILDIGLDGETRRRWLLSDLLDTRRIGFDGRDRLGSGFDWAHTNGVVADGDGVLVSVRHQDALVRIDGAGQVDWILGTPAGWTAPWDELLLQPVGEVIWPYHQHAPEVAPDGTIVVFDNHRFGYNPYEAPVAKSWSAVAGYRVDRVERTVSAAFRFDATTTGPLFSSALGDADVQPQTGNVLADYGFLDDEGGMLHADLGWGRKAVRLVEYTPAGDVVLDVRLRSDLATESEGWNTYRAERILSPWSASGVDAGAWVR